MSIYEANTYRNAMDFIGKVGCVIPYTHDELTFPMIIRIKDHCNRELFFDCDPTPLREFYGDKTPVPSLVDGLKINPPADACQKTLDGVGA